MDSKNVVNTGGGGGIKVTYIETQFVTSDAAGFKDLVQRLTGMSAPPPVSSVPHRPLPCRPDGRRRGSRTAAGADAGTTTQVYQYPVMEARPAVVSRTPPYMEEGMGMGLHLHDDYINMDDFSDLFYNVGASERSDGS